MKNNIVADRNDKIINEIVINDNAVLQYKETNSNEISAVIRYIENNSIKEIILYKTQSNLNKYSILINYDKTAVSLFIRKNDKIYLEELYDLKEHTFADTDFMDLEFKEKFPNIGLNSEMILTKK